jgi:hypothetical protein
VCVGCPLLLISVVVVGEVGFAEGSSYMLDPRRRRVLILGSGWAAFEDEGVPGRVVALG